MNETKAGDAVFADALVSKAPIELDKRVAAVEGALVLQTGGRRDV